MAGVSVPAGRILTQKRRFTMKTTFRFNPLTLVFSLLFGLAWSVLGGLLYTGLKGLLWTPLLIALYVLGLAGFLLLAIIVSNAVGNNAKPRAENYKKAAIVVAALFLCTMLFEFLYELQPSHFNIGTPTSYIFLVDDSGSMTSTDPQCTRNDAIYEVAKTCDADFPCAVYIFADLCHQALPITAAKDMKQENYGFASEGLTQMFSAIEFVLSDIQSGRLQAGNSPRILILSDGAPTDIEKYRSTVSACRANGISVSTVGFGGANPAVLQRVAEDTSGAFVWANDISQLSQAMSTAATTIHTSSRDLLGYRSFTEHTVLFGILRCLFLLIIAAGFVLIKVFMFSTFDRNNVALITFIACAALGALAPEFFINIFGWNGTLARALLCITMALLLGTSKETANTNYNNFASPAGSGGGFGGFPGSSYSNPGDKWKF